MKSLKNFKNSKKNKLHSKKTKKVNKIKKVKKGKQTMRGGKKKNLLQLWWSQRNWLKPTNLKKVKV